MNNLKSRWTRLSVQGRVAVGVGAIIALVVILKVLPIIVGAMGIGMIIFLFVGPYWIPTIVAFVRKQPNKGAVLALNLFLGWTFVGWVVSLVWALSNNSPAVGATIIVNNGVPASTQFRAGDVVNGHRFDGVGWSPVQPAIPVQAVEAMATEIS